MIKRSMLTSYINWMGVLGALGVFWFLAGPASSIHPVEGVHWAVGALSALGLFISGISVTNVITEHAKDIGNLRVIDEKIANAEQYLENVRKNFASLKDTLEATLGKLPEQLMNQDNPVSALVGGIMNELDRAETKVLERKQYKAQYKGCVEARKIGPFAWIVEVYGDK